MPWAPVGEGVRRAPEQALDGVRAVGLVTGLVNTPLWRGVVDGYPEAAQAVLDKHPSGRAADEAEIAAFAAFLLSDESPFINGAAPAIDGGLTAGY